MLEFEEYKDYLGREESCNLCGGRERTEWGRRGIFKLDECLQCGLVYINPRLTEKGLNKLYSEYFQRRADNTELTLKRNVMYQLEADFILGHLQNHKTILDVGCGGGGFLESFPKHFTKLATDYDTVAAQEAEAKGIKCYVGDLLNLEIKETPIDLIMFRGVIEHVVDPKRTLEKVCELLPPKGLLYITPTPDLNSICAEVYRGKWNMVVPDHLYYFSEPMLSHVLKALGLQLIAQHHFYEETPYADPVSDYRQLRDDLQKMRSGIEIENNSPAYWGNMMTLVYQK